MPLVSPGRAWFFALAPLTVALGLSPARAAVIEETTTAAPHGGLSLTRSNGRQVARIEDRWLVVTPDPSGRSAWLATAALDPPPEMTRGGRWQQCLFLAPDDRGVFRSSAERPFVVPPSLGVDGRGRLHAAWDSGAAVWYAQTFGAGARALATLSQRTAWTGAENQPPAPILADASLGDLAVTDAGEVWIAALRRGAHGSTTLCLARGPAHWEWEDLVTGQGFHPPVLHLLPDRSAYLAWSDTRGAVQVLHYQPGAKEKAEPHVIARSGYSSNGRNPAIISTGRQTLIAFESLYSQIMYAVEDNGTWRAAERLTSLDRRFANDVLHSPQLVLDRHGVVWLFFSDATRRFTYFTRWLGLGSGWSEISEARGIHYRAPRFESNLIGADWLSVEKHPPHQAHDIGVALSNSLAPEKREFHRVAFAAPTAADGSTTLFLDLLETAAVDRLELVLDEARKHPGNPLLTQGKPGTFDQDRVFNHGSVLYDNDKFRMWYAGVFRRRGVYWWEWLSIGYAESADGVSWTKVPTHVTGAGAEGGNLDLNLDLNPNRLPVLPWPCIVSKDQDDPDPGRRYKVVQFDRHQRQLMAASRGEYDMDSLTCPGGLYVSPDGIHWTAEPITIAFPDGKPAELVVQSFFIDQAEPDPARRWKVYGYASLVARRRAGCFAYSADGKHWISYPRNPILDPTVSEVPMVPAGPEAQIHDTVVFPYRGYYLALFHAEHDSYFLDVELAVSRDGVHFAHVKPGHKVISLGAPGAWDWQQILQSAPVVASDQLWIYYGGQAPPPELAARHELNNEALLGAAGLATLRLDGFTHLGLKPGETVGSITTVPFEVGPGTSLCLVLNAECAAGATITAEVLDPATGQPRAGYSRHECDVVQTDGLRTIVRWNGNDRLPLADRKPLAFRFWLAAKAKGGSPKLYGFGFASAAASTP
jgi:hypothetical protein